MSADAVAPLPKPPGGAGALPPGTGPPRKYRGPPPGPPPGPPTGPPPGPPTGQRGDRRRDGDHVERVRHPPGRERERVHREPQPPHDEPGADEVGARRPAAPPDPGDQTDQSQRVQPTDLGRNPVGDHEAPRT